MTHVILDLRLEAVTPREHVHWWSTGYIGRSCLNPHPNPRASSWEHRRVARTPSVRLQHTTSTVSRSLQSYTVLRPARRSQALVMLVLPNGGWSNAPLRFVHLRLRAFPRNREPQTNLLQATSCTSPSLAPSPYRRLDSPRSSFRSSVPFAPSHFAHHLCHCDPASPRHDACGCALRRIAEGDQAPPPRRKASGSLRSAPAAISRPTFPRASFPAHISGSRPRYCSLIPHFQGYPSSPTRVPGCWWAEQ
ncbi:hypothetical protein LXA43DRAFT_669420 [Ganoderma leucocontextum]|nr:hypothetical protein LXA43DRAFT_669420 [Ganoderma leucocontextum]